MRRFRPAWSRAFVVALVALGGAAALPASIRADDPAQIVIAQTTDEEFVHTFDPSPDDNVEVSTWLYCESANRGRYEVKWGISAWNRGLGDEEGALISGVFRISWRGAGGAYSVVAEEPFAFHVDSEGESNFTRNLFSQDLAAAKMELEWHASVGTVADPGASTQQVLRTTACV